MPKHQKGFTLIELLVVILVIGALSGVLLGVVNSSGVRGKARDSQRKADLTKIQTALELYFNDNRQYPESPSASEWEEIVDDNNCNLKDGSGGDPGLEPNYLDPVPVDPTYTGSTGNSEPCAAEDQYRYNYYSDGDMYNLTAIMEISTSNDDSECPDDLFNCGGAGYDTQDFCYFVKNP